MTSIHSLRFFLVVIVFLVAVVTIMATSVLAGRSNEGINLLLKKYPGLEIGLKESNYFLVATRGYLHNYKIFFV